MLGEKKLRGPFLKLQRLLLSVYENRGKIETREEKNPSYYVETVFMKQIIWFWRRAFVDYVD